MFLGLHSHHASRISYTPTIALELKYCNTSIQGHSATVVVAIQLLTTTYFLLCCFSEPVYQWGREETKTPHPHQRPLPRDAEEQEEGSGHTQTIAYTHTHALPIYPQKKSQPSPEYSINVPLTNKMYVCISLLHFSVFRKMSSLHHTVFKTLTQCWMCQVTKAVQQCCMCVYR